MGMRLEIDIAEHHYNNIMALDSVSLGRVPYKGIIMYSINAIKHGKVLEQEPRKGHWLIKENVFTGGGDPVLYCPFCKSKESEHMGGIEFPQHWDFCPKCGAKMESEADNGNND